MSKQTSNRPVFGYTSPSDFVKVLRHRCRLRRIVADGGGASSQKVSLLRHAVYVSPEPVRLQITEAARNPLKSRFPAPSYAYW